MLGTNNCLALLITEMFGTCIIQPYACTLCVNLFGWSLIEVELKLDKALILGMLNMYYVHTVQYLQYTAGMPKEQVMSSFDGVRFDGPGSLGLQYQYSGDLKKIRRFLCSTGLLDKSSPLLTNRSIKHHPYRQRGEHTHTDSTKANQYQRRSIYPTLKTTTTTTTPFSPPHLNLSQPPLSPNRSHVCMQAESSGCSLFRSLKKRIWGPFMMVRNGCGEGKLLERVFCNGAGINDCDTCRGSGKVVLETCAMYGGKTTLSCVVCNDARAISIRLNKAFEARMLLGVDSVKSRVNCLLGGGRRERLSCCCQCSICCVVCYYSVCGAFLFVGNKAFRH